MTARQMLVVVHGMLVEAHGPEKVAEMLRPPDRVAERRSRRAELAALGVEVG